jgi:transcriptional accessory protein Tex/SPT6
MQPTLLSMSGNGRQSDDASELLRLLEIEFVNKVNEVGVDLNRCSQCPHTSHCLQFVSGLGITLD